MRLLCVSDQIDPLVYSTGMRERFRDVDLVIAAGDLPAEYLSFIVSVLNKPLYFVQGNHDAYERKHHGASALPLAYQNPAPSARLDSAATSGATDISSKVRTDSGLIIAGLPGCRRYNRGANQFSETQMWLKALALMPRLVLNKILRGRYLDILITHAPPEGIHDRPDTCHHGFRAYLWLMKAFRPRYLIHGHTHLYDLNDVRMSRFLSTTIVNAFSHCVLDLETANA